MKTFGKKIVSKVLVQKPRGKNRFEALKSKILQKKNLFDNFMVVVVQPVHTDLQTKTGIDI